MKQVFFDRSGDVAVLDVPTPSLPEGHVRVRVLRSVISTGTETMTFGVGAGDASLKTLPSKVGKVLSKVSQTGVKRTLDVIRDKRRQLIPKGYSCAGVVVEVASNVDHVRVGDRVACAGAPHAEEVVVPQIMVTRVPEGVSDLDAAFTTLACIPLHGIRLAGLELGERAAVIGLGLMGQIATRLLVAAGVEVAGIDLDQDRVDLATEAGAGMGMTVASSLAESVATWTGGVGVDATLVCTGGGGAKVLDEAVSMLRDRGRVVVVGALNLELSRSGMFQKEAELVVSRSYGPGRYDPHYEEGGHDYPIGHARWTAGRNAESILRMMSLGRLKCEDLAESSYSIDEAVLAYGEASNRDAIAVSLTYPATARTVSMGATTKITVPRDRPVSQWSPVSTSEVGVSVVGLGSFAQNNLMPHLASSRHVRLGTVCNSSGLSSNQAREKWGFEVATTSFHEVLEDPECDAVLIATHHGDHAWMAAAALRAGKAVHVEKPLALSLEEALEHFEDLGGIETPFSIGFNRRYSPDTDSVLGMLEGRSGPVQIVYRVAAGLLPEHHWVRDTKLGGGRLVGEVCHFVDLAYFLIGSNPVRFSCYGGGHQFNDDSLAIQIQYEDGSQLQLLYTGYGSSALPKERIEVHWDGRSALIEDFRGVSDEEGKGWSLKSGDKGFSVEMDAFIRAVRGEPVLRTDLRHALEITRQIECLRSAMNRMKGVTPSGV